MKIKELKPNQIVTLNDYPLHNVHVLKIFFKIFKEGYGKMIPPCPVIDKELVVHSFDNKLKIMFNRFEDKNPQAHYLLLDGSHKTTAATITGNKIKAMIFESDKDVEEAKKLAEIGELFNFTLPSTLKENINILKDHFKKKNEFQTVEEKTKKMIEEKKIPDYMIKYYRKK
ncbi:MAG: hypothetical protein RL557_938 [archaeon]|jgi:hypothetical protein